MISNDSYRSLRRVGLSKLVSANGLFPSISVHVLSCLINLFICVLPLTTGDELTSSSSVNHSHTCLISACITTPVDLILNAQRNGFNNGFVDS